VQHVRDAPAQHQRREGASHPRQLGIALTLGMDPAIERIDDARSRTSDLHGLGQVAKAIQKPTHGGLGRDATALSPANSIGDSRHNIAAWFGQLQTKNGTSEILVAVARAGLRGKPHACLHARNPLSHRDPSDQRARF
jgi:hypothetical protein